MIISTQALDLCAAHYSSHRRHLQFLDVEPIHLSKSQLSAHQHELQPNLQGKNMRLSSKSRYAVSAMIELAKHEECGPISLRVISIHQSISLSYLESMFAQLRQCDLVSSSKGPGGGYCLGRSACLITVADIIEALNELPYMRPADARDQSVQCVATDELWNSMNANALEFLRSVCLFDLVSKSSKAPNDSQAPSTNNCGVRSMVIQQKIPRNIPNSVFALGQMNSSRA